MTREEAARILDETPIRVLGITDVLTYIEALERGAEALREPERKKGQWIILISNEDSAVCKCSVCGEDFVFYNGEFFPNYCGDCGSDMRKVRKNDKVSL